MLHYFPMDFDIFKTSKMGSASLLTPLYLLPFAALSTRKNEQELFLYHSVLKGNNIPSKGKNLLHLKGDVAVLGLPSSYEVLFSIKVERMVLVTKGCFPTLTCHILTLLP